MKKIFTFLLFLPLFYLGQKQGNIWYFGDHAGLDFNTSLPTPLLNSQIDFISATQQWSEGCSSISDSSGSLLFYSNGVNIWNKLQTLMPNGTGLLGHKSSSQSCLIVPQPNNNRYFYVFTTDALENSYQNGLRYSIVDMCLDNNKGDVLLSTKNTQLVSATSEKLICVRHSNGTDYWVITHKFNSDAFYSFKLTSTGITATVISNTGTIDTEGVGQMVASPNGLKLAYVITHGVPSIGRSLLLDFNPTTGLVSNEQVLSQGGREFGVSFSPDNSKLYFSTIGVGNLFQYDMNAGNIAAIIASKTNILLNQPDGLRHHLLGPDGNIYISRTQRKNLCGIKNPNSTCPSCNYVDSLIYLGGKFTSFGLPNFIVAYQYSNTMIPSCTGDLGIHSQLESNFQIFIYPNPNNGSFKLRIDNNIENGELILINSLGQKVYEQKIISGTNNISPDRLSHGLYHYVLLQNKVPTNSGNVTVE